MHFKLVAVPIKFDLGYSRLVLVTLNNFYCKKYFELKQLFNFVDNFLLMSYYIFFRFYELGVSEIYFPLLFF